MWIIWPNKPTRQCKSDDTCECAIYSHTPDQCTVCKDTHSHTAESHKWCDRQLIRAAGYQRYILGSGRSSGTRPPPLFPQAFWPHASITGTQAELANLTDGAGVISAIETQASSADLAVPCRDYHWRHIWEGTVSVSCWVQKESLCNAKSMWLSSEDDLYAFH